MRVEGSRQSGTEFFYFGEARLFCLHWFLLTTGFAFREYIRRTVCEVRGDRYDYYYSLFILVFTWYSRPDHGAERGHHTGFQIGFAACFAEHTHLFCFLFFFCLQSIVIVIVIAVLVIILLLFLLNAFNDTMKIILTIRRRISIVALLLLVTATDACTDILVTPGASVEGTAMIAYNADSPTLFGSVYQYPPSSKDRRTQWRRAVYDWDSGVYLGDIPEATETYNVVGNSNEHGLLIGESTFGGIQRLAHHQTGAKIDYGSLIWLTLQRAKTVQQAIRTMVHLMDTYGYASAGESFSLADASGQVWIMEVIGRGNEILHNPNDSTSPRKLGAVWVAQRIPDGMVSAHANQARITTFPRDDPDNCLYADDVVDVAVHYGLYDAQADPLKFSFSDVYDPLDFIGARQGEARVWSVFSQIAQDPHFAQQYQEYALGNDLSHRMPLYLAPKHKLTKENVMQFMTSHYEGTVMDASQDVGSGLFASPYRPRPLVWSLEEDTEEEEETLQTNHGGRLLRSTENKESSKPTRYHNERSIATAKTGWSFVAEIRPHMPPGKCFLYLPSTKFAAKCLFVSDLNNLL